MHSNKIEQLKANLKISPIQREWLWGLLLGDAHLETQNHGRTYRLKIEQSIVHKSYVDWLFGIFKDLVLTPPREKLQLIAGKYYRKYGFQTLSLGQLRFFASQFYLGKRKKVPKLIKKWLTPMALATWFMDDGSIKSKQTSSLILNTQGFRKSEVRLLIEALKERFQVQCIIRKQKEGFQIFIPAGQSYRFYELIKNYIHPSMNYKLMNIMPKE